MGNFLDSVATMGGTIYKDIKQKDQLFNSNKLNLETAYQNQITDFMQTLPSSLDFDSYSQRVDEFNSDFISQARKSGNFDERSLAWLEQEFIPSQKASNEQAVSGVSNYAINTWLSSQANSYANLLAADSSKGVEDAYNDYKTYYEKVGLGNIENGNNAYGYLKPEEFREIIRETKTVQAFEQDAKNRFGYDPTWNSEKALSEAMSKTGYKPNASQMITLKQKAESTMAQVKKDIQNAVSEDAVNFTADISNYILQGLYYDTSDLDAAIASYPVTYASPLMELKISAQNSNDAIVYNMVATGSMPLDDETLSCFSPDSDYRTKIITADVTTKAQAMFNSGTQIRDVMAWIRNGDFGYTASAAEREAIAGSVLTWAKNQKTTQEQMDDIDLFYVENPQLVGDTATVSYADSLVFSESEETATEKELPALPANKAHKAHKAVGLDDTETVTTPKLEGIAPKASDGISMGTTSAQNQAQKATASQTAIASVDNAQMYDQLFNMKYVECLPNDVIKAKVEQAYKSGYLTKKTAEELSADFVFGDNDTWQGLIGSVNETIDNMMPDAGYQEKKNVKTRIYKALVQSVGNNWSMLEDAAAMNSAIRMIENDVSASSWLGKAQSYSKASDSATGYLKALRKATYGDMRDAMTDGSLTPFINVSAQNEYLKGNPQSNGSVSDARDFFSKELGFGNSYDELTDMEKLLVEYNVAYSQFRGDIRSLFVDTFETYVDTGASDMLWVNTELGGTFAFSDSENPNLYYFPDVSTIKKENGKLSATWFYSYDTNGDGGPDSEPVKLTSLARIVSDMGGLLEKEEKKNEKNAKKSEGLNEFAEATGKASEELRSAAYEGGAVGMAVLVPEANKASQYQFIADFLKTLFSPSTKRKDEDKIITTTLESIRNQ